MKDIKGVQDLAANGAEPAFDRPLHVGRPNIGSKNAFLRYVDEIFESGWLTNNGPLVLELEQRIAEIHQVSHCVAICNGTLALEIAIRALEMQGEVVVPSFTFVATVHALSWQGITPVFVDIDPVTHHLNPEAVCSRITPNTTGIIGVHTWGHIAPVETLQKIAEKHDLKLLFDAAHAFGCAKRDQMVGNFGDCEVLSFHATKFFNTFEGGAVLTNNETLAKKIRLMRNFGFSGYDNVIHPGTNGKMTEIAAAMGLVNLEDVGSLVRENRRAFDRYRLGFSRISGVRMISPVSEDRTNYQYVVIEVDDEANISRDEIVDALHAENVLARRYFWPGSHQMQPYCEQYPDAGRFLPITENVARRVIVLPTGPSMSDQSIDTVVEIVGTMLGAC